jgi:hypothetical protein
LPCFDRTIIHKKVCERGTFYHPGVTHLADFIFTIDRYASRKRTVNSALQAIADTLLTRLEQLGVPEAASANGVVLDILKSELLSAPIRASFGRAPETVCRLARERPTARNGQIAHRGFMWRSRPSGQDNWGGLYWWREIDSGFISCGVVTAWVAVAAITKNSSHASQSSVRQRLPWIREFV